MIVQHYAGLYAVFDGIERKGEEIPINLGVSLGGKSKLEIRGYTQDITNEVIDLDNSKIINGIADALRNARADGYVSLARRQPFYKDGIVALDAMEEAIREYDRQFWSSFSIWGEVMDSQPHLRFPNLRLPRDKNAVLYRGWWTVKDGTIDVTDMDSERDLVAVTVPERHTIIDQKWIDVTNASRDTHHVPANLDYSRQNLNGFNVLRWDFYDESPTLRSGREIRLASAARGTVLASRLSIGELMKRFEPVELQS